MADSPASASEPTQTVESLLAQLTESADTEQQRAAAYALGQLGARANSAVPALIESLASKDLQLCWYAADALGKIGADASAATDALLREIDNPANLEIFPVIALRALGRIGKAEGVTAKLLEMLNHSDPTRRISAGFALWQIEQNRQGIAAIIALSGDPTSETAILANTALLDVDDLTANELRAVLSAFQHDDRDVRLAAARVVGQNGRGMVDELINILDSTNDGERTAATLALGDVIDDVRETVLLDESTSEQEFLSAARPLVVRAAPIMLSRFAENNEERRAVTQRTLAKMGPLLLPKLVPLLESPDDAVRKSASAVLRRMQPYFPEPAAMLPGIELVKRSAAPVLIHSLANGDEPTRLDTVRVLAIFPLRDHREQLEPLLRRALREKNVQIRRFAATTLELLNDRANR